MPAWGVSAGLVDGHDLVGMVAQADVARALPNSQVGDLLEALSTD